MLINNLYQRGGFVLLIPLTLREDGLKVEANQGCIVSLRLAL